MFTLLFFSYKAISNRLLYEQRITLIEYEMVNRFLNDINLSYPVAINVFVDLISDKRRDRKGNFNEECKQLKHFINNSFSTTIHIPLNEELYDRNVIKLNDTIDNHYHCKYI